MEFIDMYTWEIIIGVFGPTIVGAITGLKTPSWVKALFALLIVTGFAVFSVLQAGALVGQDIFQGIIIMVVVWQAFYGMLWKGTGVADWLQERFPLFIGEEKTKG